jgi:hypothetical protein
LTAVHFSSEFHLAKERRDIFIQKESEGEKTTQIVRFAVNHKELTFSEIPNSEPLLFDLIPSIAYNEPHLL